MRNIKIINFTNIKPLAAIFFSLLILSSVPLFAANGKIKLNLEPILKHFELNSSNVKSVMTAYIDDQVGFNESLTSEVNMDFISVNVLDLKTTNIPALELTIKPNDTLQLLASRYFADGIGTINYFVQAKENQTFLIDNSDIKAEIKLFGNPCKDKVHPCHLLLPSWKILQLYTSKNIPMVPNFITVMHHAKGLSLVNSESGRFWMNLPMTEIMGQMGQARHVNYLGAGVLKIKFDAGVFLVDFKHDVIMMVKDNKVSILREGLANHSMETIIVEVGDQNKLLHAGKLGLLWKDRAIVGNLLNLWISHNKYIVLYMNKVADKGAFSMKGEKVFLNFIGRDNEHSALGFYQMAVSENSLKEAASPTVLDETVKKSLFILGDSLYQLTADGIYLLQGNGKKQATSLSMSRDELNQIQTNSLMTKIGTGKQCNWEAYYRDSVHPASFMNTGMQIACGEFNNMSESDAGYVITVLSGNILSISYHLN